MARTIRTGDKRFSGRPTRLQEQVRNNLGTIMTDSMSKNQKFRDQELDTLDAYYENRAYDDLMNWDEACGQNQEEYVPVRKRKPRVIYNVAKVLVNKVASKLVGSQSFPTFSVEDDPDDTQFFRVVQKAANFRRKLLQPIKHMLISGSVFVRFYLVEGMPVIEHFNSKFCYPQFDAKGELSVLEVRYVFADPDDKDANGKPVEKWFRMVLTQDTDIMFDNPPYRPGSTPQFKQIEENNHGLGWVQGEWFRTEEHKFSPDGPGLFSDITDFIDDLNYSLSQTSQAVSYNQDPQLAVNGIDEDELDKLIRSSQKAWNLGREGKGQFLESNMNGVKEARESRSESRNRMLDVVRVIMMDPEKVVGNASSGKAMEILHGPLCELIDELRTVIEPSLRNLLVKLSLTLLAFGERGDETVIDVPPGYVPESLDLTLAWPAMFPPTIEDIQKKVAAAVQATTAKILSRETATRWIGPDLEIEDIDAELEKIAAEPDLPSPFGSFGG